jgi:hypothetical protein
MAEFWNPTDPASTLTCGNRLCAGHGGAVRARSGRFRSYPCSRFAPLRPVKGLARWPFDSPSSAPTARNTRASSTPRLILSAKRGTLVRVDADTAYLNEIISRLMAEVVSATEVRTRAPAVAGLTPGGLPPQCCPCSPGRRILGCPTYVCCMSASQHGCEVDWARIACRGSAAAPRRKPTDTGPELRKWR